MNMNFFTTGSNPYSASKVSIITDDTIKTYPLQTIAKDLVEFKEGLLPLDEAKMFFDSKDGGLHYLYNLDVPAKLEAAKLKTLRRSVALQNIFSFDRSKPFDIFRLLPWIITIITLLVHK